MMENLFAVPVQKIEKNYFAAKPIQQNGQEEIYDFQKGNPQLPPPKEVLNAFMTAFHEDGAHQYSALLTTETLKDAVRFYYEQTLSCTWNKHYEVLMTMGAKDALYKICTTFLNAGDAVLIPDPGYVSYRSIAQLCNAEVITYALQEEHDWQIDMADLRKLNNKNIKLIFINQLQMPTGKTWHNDSIEKLLQWAEERNVIVVNDNPYVVLSDLPIKSLMANPIAQHRVLEITSLSKSHNLPGWRIGVIIGNAQLIQGIQKVHLNVTNGFFIPFLKAAEVAFSLEKRWYKDLKSHYNKQRVLLEKIISKISNLEFSSQQGMFCWTKIPPTMQADNVMDKLHAQYRIKVVPGSLFGSEGANYLRWSLCIPTQQLTTLTLKINEHE